MQRKYSFRFLGPNDQPYEPGKVWDSARTVGEYIIKEAANFKNGTILHAWTGHDYEGREPDATLTVGSFKPDDEVEVTITGRVLLAASGGPIVIEYINSKGKPARITVDRAAWPDVHVSHAIADEATRKRRMNVWHEVARERAGDPDAYLAALKEVPYQGDLDA